MLVGRNVFTKLLIDLLDDLGGPALYLVEDEVDLLAQLIGFFLVLGEALNVLVKLLDLRGKVLVDSLLHLLFVLLVD